MLSKGPSRVFSSTTVQEHQFFGTQPFLWSNSYIRTNRTWVSYIDGSFFFFFFLLSEPSGKPLDNSSSSSVAQSCPTPCDPMNCSTQASLSITNSRSSLKLRSFESVMPSSHLILCCPLFLLPPIPLSVAGTGTLSRARNRALI